MKKIVLSLAIMLFAGGVLVSGVTGAFFSDTETSSGNTFTAGAIDLKVDNTSYYNGVLNPGTTWALKDLTTIDKFFNFLDLKPDDYGEDTISLHVNTNDAYLCANVMLTSNDDNGFTDPEDIVDDTPGPTGGGELANQVNFLWWADDGDNVLEVGENRLPGGPIGALTLNQPMTIALADSAVNIWNPHSTPGGPAPGNKTLYIGKAWCFGTISAAPLLQSFVSANHRPTTTPAQDGNNNDIFGQPEDGGYTCDGTSLGNETQTDSLTADISFSATQARNHPGFLCVPHQSSPHH